MLLDCPKTNASKFVFVRLCLYYFGVFEIIQPQSLILGPLDFRISNPRKMIRLRPHVPIDQVWGKTPKLRGLWIASATLKELKLFFTNLLKLPFISSYLVKVTHVRTSPEWKWSHRACLSGKPLMWFCSYLSNCEVVKPRGPNVQSYPHAMQSDSWAVHVRTWVAERFIEFIETVLSTRTLELRKGRVVEWGR